MMMRSHRMLTAAAWFVLSFSPCLAFADSGDAAQGQDNAQIAMVRSGTSLPMAQPIPAAAVPAVRRLDADAEVTGSEPDPEAFDRQGLDRWWQHHQQPNLPGDQR